MKNLFENSNGNGSSGHMPAPTKKKAAPKPEQPDADKQTWLTPEDYDVSGTDQYGTEIKQIIRRIIPGGGSYFHAVIVYSQTDTKGVVKHYTRHDRLRKKNGVVVRNKKGIPMPFEVTGCIGIVYCAMTDIINDEEVQALYGRLQGHLQEESE